MKNFKLIGIFLAVFFAASVSYAADSPKSKIGPTLTPKAETQKDNSSPTLSCIKTDAFTKVIKKSGYQIRFMGLVNEERATQIYTNDSDNSWLVVLATSDGLSCVLAGGKEFMIFGDKPVSKSRAKGQKINLIGEQKIKY